jgi:hypothetical protein
LAPESALGHPVLLRRNSIASFATASKRVGGRLQLVPLKTKSSIGAITLPQTAIVALKRQRVRQMEQQLAAGSDWHGNPNNLSVQVAARNAGRTAQCVSAIPSAA